MLHFNRLLTIVALISLILGACAPGSETNYPAADQPAADQPAADQPVDVSAVIVADNIRIVPRLYTPYEAILDCSSGIKTLSDPELRQAMAQQHLYPGCMEREPVMRNDEDRAVGPIIFQICQASTCNDLVANTDNLVNTSGDFTIKAPDGKTPNEQMARIEEDVFLRFHSWHIGTDGDYTPNPLPLTIQKPAASSSSPETVEIIAYFSVWELDSITTDAESQGCSSTSPVLGPNWVEVEPDYHFVEGPVSASNIAHEDYPGTHNSQDLNFWVLLSGEEPYLKLAVDERSGQRGARPDQIQIEWESGSYPTWAWPSPEVLGVDEQPLQNIDDADLAWVYGKWIFDCGHQESYIDKGAWTEIHPPVAVAVMRNTYSGKYWLRDEIARHVQLQEKATGLEGVQIDMWINGDGGGAVEQVKCGDGLNFGNGCLLKEPYDFDIRQVYEFDVPLPSKSSLVYPESGFQVGVIRLQPGQPRPEITRNEVEQKLHIKVDLTNYQDTWGTCQLQNQLYGENLVNCHGNAYGVTIIAGWEAFEYPPDLYLLRLSATEVKMFTDMEGEDGDGEFNLFLDVGPASILGGDPEYVKSSVALHAVNPDLLNAEGNGESYPLGLTYTLKIRKNDPGADKLRLFLHGFEDDPIWDDELSDLERIFEANWTLWKPQLPPPWWPDCTPTSDCPYGQETNFGTVRGKFNSPIYYEDQVTSSFAPKTSTGYEMVMFRTYALLYTIEEIQTQ